MNKISLQVYGLPMKEGSLLKILTQSEITNLELNVVNESDLTWYQDFLENHHQMSASGVHFNLLLLDKVGSKATEFIKKYGANTLIIPAALEENSLVWPLIYLRRFPSVYHFVLKVIDRVWFKGFRKKIAGRKANKLSYYTSDFWCQFAHEIKLLKDLGLNIGYHNHGIEFEKFKMDQTIFELLDQKLDKEIFFQMDITNLLMSGHYSVELIKKYKHRIKSFHLRIEGPGTENFYQELFENHPAIFENKEMVIELKENSPDEMIKRNLWWKGLINSVS